VRDAVRAGRVYVSHDWIADPTGFRFYVAGDGGEPKELMGDEVEWRAGARLVAELSHPAHIRVLRDGVEVASVPRASRIDHTAEQPGVYRIEAFVEIGGETRPWIFSNPIYLRQSRSTGE
jgi:hypothetical protein